jgi:hypothetical protein
MDCTPRRRHIRVAGGWCCSPCSRTTANFREEIVVVEELVQVYDEVSNRAELSPKPYRRSPVQDPLLEKKLFSGAPILAISGAHTAITLLLIVRNGAPGGASLVTKVVVVH